MEHIFHKIILNIYFDHIHIMCLYIVFSVYCMGYTLVYNKSGVNNELNKIDITQITTYHINIYEKYCAAPP